MSDAMRFGTDDRAFDSEARQRLAEALRRLVDVTMTADTSDAELDAAADALEGVSEALTGHKAPPPGVRVHQQYSHDDYLPRSPYVGHASPLAPPIDIDVTPGRCVGIVTFGAAYEGPPGHVHGGVIASAFDEILGIANIASGNPGMTGKLTIRYRRPTPLHAPLRFEGWTDNVEGRRIIARGTLHHGDELCAEAEGLFVVIEQARSAKYFGPEHP